MDTCSHGRRVDPSSPCPQCDAPAEAGPPGRSRWRAGATAAAVVAAVVVVATPSLLSGNDQDEPAKDEAATAAVEDDAEPHRLRGTFVLIDPDRIEGPADACTGTGAFDDVRPGLEITVRDDEGTILAVTGARNMTAAEVDEYLVDQNISGVLDPEQEEICPLAFAAEVRPAASYRVEMGSRATITTTADRLAEDDWRVSYVAGL